MVQVHQVNGGMERNNTLSTAQTITIPSGATHLMIQALTNDVVITLDGSTPTTTNGFVLTKNAIIQFTIHASTVIKVIEYVASAEIRYQFFTENIR